MKQTSSKSHSSKPVTAMFEKLEGRQLMSVSPYIVNGTSNDDVIEISYGLDLVVATADTLDKNGGGGSPTILMGEMPVGPEAFANVSEDTTNASAADHQPPRQRVGHHRRRDCDDPKPGCGARPDRQRNAGERRRQRHHFVGVRIHPGLLDTIFNRLVVTVNGVSTSPQLQPGQTIQVDAMAGNDKVTIKGDRTGVVVNGGFGDDRIIGAAGNDTLNGEFGNDFIDGGTGADVMSGGEGADTIDYGSRSSRVTVNLDGAANDGYSGEADNVAADFEVVNGGWGNDYLTASDAVGRTYNGGFGNDLIMAGAGDDVIHGGRGRRHVARRRRQGRDLRRQRRRRHLRRHRRRPPVRRHRRGLHPRRGRRRRDRHARRHAVGPAPSATPATTASGSTPRAPRSSRTPLRSRRSRA